VIYIIFIGSLKKGGAERNAAMLANHLCDQGHCVKLLMLSPEIAFDLDKRVERKILGKEKYVFRSLKILHIWFSLFIQVWKVKPRRLITLSRISGILAALTMYPKAIVRFDAYPLIGYKKYKEWQFWIFYNFPFVKYVVCPSKELLNDVKNYFINSRKLKQIYNPVPLIKDKSVIAFQHERPYFVIVSRLNRQKNIDQLIEAFYSSKAYVSTDLLILGDGALRKELEEKIEKMKLGSVVRLLGFIEDPLPYMKGSIALLNASLREGFPNVMVECLSVGTPVISSRTKTGPSEIISHGENGYLFDMGDYDRLKLFIQKITDDAGLLSTLKNKCDVGLDRFSHKKVMADWDKIL